MTVTVDPAQVRRRTLALLVVGQILGGLGTGAALSVGALAASDIAGESWSGMAATMSTLGAAVVAVPLARLAERSGRRVSLTTAAVVAAAGLTLCVAALELDAAILLFGGLAGAGAATAAALQSRFAATDLATPTSRGRDLSLVVWSTTVGAVAGPNLAEPGDSLGGALGLAPFGGIFVVGIVAQLGAAIAYAVFLRPDPLTFARASVLPSDGARRVDDAPGEPRFVRLAIMVLATSHATMVALMAMTPVHLVHGGATLSIVGITISLHVAGMFALSPIFGIVSDRLGRIPTVLAGQALLAASAVVTAVGAHSHALVMVGLTLLGLGWSASTIAGAALLADAAPARERVRLQGRSDMLMSFAGAAGGAVAGPVLAFASYAGLAWGLLVPVLVTVTGIAVVRYRSPGGLSRSLAS